VAVGVGWALARYVFDFTWTAAPWVPLAGALAGAVLALAAGWWGLREVLLRPVVDTLRRAAEERAGTQVQCTGPEKAAGLIGWLLPPSVADLFFGCLSGPPSRQCPADHATPARGARGCGTLPRRADICVKRAIALVEYALLAIK
jgi:hypothetical protein